MKQQHRTDQHPQTYDAMQGGMAANASATTRARASADASTPLALFPSPASQERAQHCYSTASEGGRRVARLGAASLTCSDPHAWQAWWEHGRGKRTEAEVACERRRACERHWSKGGAAASFRCCAAGGQEPQPPGRIRSSEDIRFTFGGEPDGLGNSRCGPRS